MGTKCLKREGDAADGSHTNRSRFFKIVVNPRDHRLRIPSGFMRRHGRYLPDHVSLKAPNGPVRDVLLLHTNGKTWLHKGWQEFKEYYSIGFGHLLEFTYNGNSHFNVLIYGVNEMEIEYSNNNINGDKGIDLNRASSRVPKTEDIESDSDDSVVFLKEASTNKKREGGRKNVGTSDHKWNRDFVQILEEHSSARQQRKRKSTNDLYSRNSNKLNKVSDDCPAQKSSRGMPSFSSHAKENSRKKAPVPNCRDEPVRASRVKPEECSEGTGIQRTVYKETSIAYQRAESSKFCKPYWISLMQPSYVSRNFILFIPSARNFLPQMQNELKLHNSKGKTWFVKCTIGRQRSQLTSGWKKFVLDNSLKVSDACVFEVNKSNPLVWKVTIFRS